MAIARQDGDDLAGPHPRGPQAVDQPVHPGVELRAGELGELVDDRRPVGIGVRQFPEMLCHLSPSARPSVRTGGYRSRRAKLPR